MAQFLCHLKPTRSNMLSDGPSEEELLIIEQHFFYLKNLANQGIVLMAGRTLKDDENAIGMVIIVADDESSAQKIMEADPVVMENVMNVEIFPFRIALWSSDGPSAS